MGMTNWGGLSRTVKSAVGGWGDKLTKFKKHATRLKRFESKLDGDGRTHSEGGTLSCSSPRSLHIYPEVSER